MNIKKWVKLYIGISLFTLVSFLSFNFIIDPYSITSYNILNIPNKFARDDRQEKVAKFLHEEAYDNILFGSSRVYGNFNPLVLSRYLGGKSYNSGVGTARIEDHLGFLLYLERIKKLPKNIVLGLDFYSFNPNLETNSYFIKNNDLNFMKSSLNTNLYFSKLLSVDALRASFATLKNFLKDSKSKPRFNDYGVSDYTSSFLNYYPEKIETLTYTEKELDKGLQDLVTTKYEKLSKKRLNHLREIVSLCERNQINYTVFSTPFAGQMLSKVEEDKKVNSILLKYKSKIAEITSFYDFITHNEINDNRFYFAGDTQHTWPFTANLMMARMFNDKNVSLPKNFGVFRPKTEIQP